MSKKNKKLKGRLETISSKSSQALKYTGVLDEKITKLQKERRQLATDLMIGGILISLSALFYDHIARLLTHRYAVGFGQDQVITLFVGVVITIWGWRRR